MQGWLDREDKGFQQYNSQDEEDEEYIVRAERFESEYNHRFEVRGADSNFLQENVSQQCSFAGWWTLAWHMTDVGMQGSTGAGTMWKSRLQHSC